MNSQQQTTAARRAVKRSRSAKGPNKRAKSANVSPLRRYLIATCSLIWVKSDQRERTETGELVPTTDAKKPAPSSDMSQMDMTQLYFDGIDRTVVSQSKHGHRYAPPNFEHLNPYLFPFIRFNSNPSRSQIRHVAFRIWEILVNDGRVGVLKFPGGEENPLNTPLGDVRGWWLETETEKPRGYAAWHNECDGYTPRTVPCLQR
jgi:hypothetical protein